jgi:acetyl-CoA carboxylase biotin carboxyl carrier protein
MTDKKTKGIGDRVVQAIKGESGPHVDADAVREMAALLEETELTEIEIEKNGVRIRVARHAGVSVAMPAAGAVHPAPLAAKVAEAPAPEAHAKRGTLVTSPMVGTVYLSPQPGAPTFVKVGDAVTDGTVCIIEAMKTMNPVAATASGRVAEIYVHDGQPVEFGEPLMLID